MSDVTPEMHERVRRVVVTATIASLAMLVVGLFLAALGILILKVAGGAAHDTSLAVLVAAYAVTDMWGASIVAGSSGAPVRLATAAWCVMHCTWLVLLTFVLWHLWPITLTMAVLSVPMANIGARVGLHHRLLAS